MNRRNLLKGMGALGAAGAGAILLPGGKAIAGTTGARAAAGTAVDCILIPQETEGPYGLDLSENANMFRQDITEGREGTPLDLTLTILNAGNNCQPIANARVDIWHCDKDGVYSGYAQPGANTVGQTFMRGIQMTDAEGKVRFHTIYPGWYNGRITHIHFQVFVGSMLRATSQMAFPDSLNETVYGTSLYTRGRNSSVANNAADSVFAGGPGDLAHELLTITTNETTGGYNGTLTVGVEVPTSGIIELEPETGGQFKLRQNFPNPFVNRTVIDVLLTRPSKVELTLFDTSGRRVASLFDGRMDGGEQRVEWDRASLERQLAAGAYVYQLTVENELGVFRQAKVMTAE